MACTNQSEEGSNIPQKQGDHKGVTAEEDIRKVVWEQLPSDQKEFIKGTWKDGDVSKVKVTDHRVSSNLTDINLDLIREVYAITFPTNSISSTNNLVVYADIESNQYIGNGLVD
ncbi:hypothetical protein [Pseudalkalibacillus hwajinpoensis]|uniref:Uncharacterized protein n=1 Tax=Guptibacillus hwajinpoensis TaxID=208199 RepID=A0A4U1MMU3_9BACL|nr:hypothetical protein [Pseudalkalibacillus hwajinpoensis]TKD72307.1 hypothetical protein FBF83_05830 [Pseudalkalibacillus hwajinpoensis]